MRKVEGTATISIEELDKLRERETWYTEIHREAKGLIENIDSARFDELMKRIDDMPNDISDDEVDGLCKEAAGTLRIIVSERHLRNLIREHIEEVKSECHYAISEMTKEEFEVIPLSLGKEQGNQTAEIIKRLEDESKRKDKVIEEASREIKRLKKNVNDLQLEKSYMVNPMAIGDRHEMGG